MNRIGPIVSLFLGIVGLSAAANAGSYGCDRSLDFQQIMNGQFLNQSEKAQLNKGQLVSKFVRQPNGYDVGYIFQIGGQDAALVMGIFTSADEHAGKKGLGDYFVRSKILNSDKTANPFRVEYEQQVDFPYSNSEYVVENQLSAGKTSDGKDMFTLNTRLISSNDSSFAPQESDGYLKTVSLSNSTFVIGCNYMVPRTTSFRDTYNSKAADRFILTGKNLNAWVERVSTDSSKAEGYRNRFKALLAHANILNQFLNNAVEEADSTRTGQ